MDEEQNCRHCNVQSGRQVGEEASPLTDLVLNGLLMLVQVGRLSRHLHNPLGRLPHARPVPRSCERPLPNPTCSSSEADQVCRHT